MARISRDYVVACYRLDGTLFRIYESASKASKARRCHPRTIDKCIRGDALTAFGHMWRRFPCGEVPKTIESFENKRVVASKSPIALVGEYGEILKHYPSIKNASNELGIDPHSIRDVLSGKYKSSKGYVFRRLTAEEIAQFGYEKISEITHIKSRILQYDLNGNYVNTYDSINDVCKYLERKHAQQAIKDVLMNRRKTAYGYVWRYEDNSKKRNVSLISILQLDLNGKVIGKYHSVKEASIKSNISVSSINNAISGRRKSAGGYIWKRN